MQPASYLSRITWAPAMDEDVPDMYSAVCIELNNYSTTFSTSNGSCDISFLLSTTTGVATPVIFHKILSSVGWNRNDSIRSRRPTSTKGTHEIQSSIKKKGEAYSFRVERI